MPKLTEYELEREANIRRNEALLEQLELKEAVAQLGLPPKAKPPQKTKSKPIQPSKKAQRDKIQDNAPRRQSLRLKKVDEADPNESPSKKRKREQDQEAKRRKEEQERLELEERSRIAKRPRHQDLNISTLSEDGDAVELAGLTSALQTITQTIIPKCVGEGDAFAFENDKDKKDRAALSELRGKLEKLKIVARAKVTQDRIYSAAYHPEVSKDLVFFGDKHGQLGIWDAQAPSDEVADEDGVVTASDNKEGGKYWRLQLHWPATSRSSISCIKFDPIDSHSVYTSSYDCTIRNLSFTSGISREIFSTEDTLISSIDLVPTGHEMWISDALGGLTHLDLREDRSKAKWYGLSGVKIGSVSINPTNPTFLLTASNSRTLKVWDARKLATIADSHPTNERIEFDYESTDNFLTSKPGQGCLRGEFQHNQSVTSAYWDPQGRRIVSTSYDDNLRLWDVDPSRFNTSTAFPSFQPFSRISHNCQTGRWLTMLRAQWSPNPDVYPHFTIGNMNHSLDIISCKGDLITRLSDSNRITAVQAVTCSHPSILERAASGNASGRCVLWAATE